MLTTRIAARAAASAADARRAHACASSTPSRRLGCPNSDLAYAIARAGIFDDYVPGDPCPRDALYRMLEVESLSRCALRGAIESGQARLVTYIGVRCGAPAERPSHAEAVWLAAQRELPLDFGSDVDPAIKLAAKGDIAAAETALASSHRELMTERCIRTLAGCHGPYRVLRWAFRRLGGYMAADAYGAVAQILLGGNAWLMPFRRHAGPPFERGGYYLAMCASCGGNPRAASALLRLLTASGRSANTTLGDLVVGACLHSSFRVLAFAARGLGGNGFLRTLAGCTIGHPHFVSHRMECASDARLSDALACIEFLLLLQRAPRFNRGRLLAFQTPRKLLFTRAAPCLGHHVKSRLGFRVF